MPKQPACKCHPNPPASCRKTFFYTCQLCGRSGAHGAPKPLPPVAKSKKFGFQGSTAWSTPLVSISAGCHPNQVPEFNKMAKESGISGVYYNRRGECEFSSRKARRDWNKFRGMRDNDGGYRD